MPGSLQKSVFLWLLFKTIFRTLEDYSFPDKQMYFTSLLLHVTIQGKEYTPIIVTRVSPAILKAMSILPYDLTDESSPSHIYFTKQSLNSGHDLNRSLIIVQCGRRICCISNPDDAFRSLQFWVPLQRLFKNVTDVYSTLCHSAFYLQFLSLQDVDWEEGCEGDLFDGKEADISFAHEVKWIAQDRAYVISAYTPVTVNVYE